MKVAISNAVMTYAQAAHRHPRCVTPVSGVPSGDLAAHQAHRILELDGELAAARARIVDLRGALQRIALDLGLPEDAETGAILAAIRRRR